jgi:hypothetical protein
MVLLVDMGWQTIAPLLILANTSGIEYKLKINTASKNDATTKTTALLGI